MKRRICWLTIVLLTLFGASTLMLPIANVIDTVGDSIVIKGYNMIEFSPWGSVVVSIPLILIALFLCHMNKTQKTIGIIILHLANSVGVYNALTKAYSWINSIQPKFIHKEPYPILYVLIILIALIVFFVYNEFDCSG